ncbi:MAG: tRNA uridine(34) 5-carboxymethylaminomethyl modification radical SAM/GNAT enzyme Elp3 [bacterium]|nr:tRNA uridine(34) 5-carboxymethylaminomethyl modification radical SAM/GNAT enzyme Elp3 [bacterium]
MARAESENASRKSPRPVFDPLPHEPELVAIIEKLLAEGGFEPGRLDAILREHPRGGKALFSRSQLIAGYRQFSPQHGWPLAERDFAARLRKRKVRTLSGVAPVTVLTKPYPCPGQCIFCPSDVRMPKSYLSAEPGAQRATRHEFDPYRQTQARLRAFYELGHPTDKVELIVLGGTWSFYPETYRIWFVKRCLDALNDFGEDGAGSIEKAVGAGKFMDFLDLDASFDGGSPEASYNRVVTRHLRRVLDGELLSPGEAASRPELEVAQKRNETGRSRMVGLSLETRPDHLDDAEVLSLRRLGATKVQIGVQSLSDEVLERNRRGHDSAQTRDAIRRLRAAGFKIHAHWMPNLCGATPESDLEDFEQIFSDPAIRPDELKIYPTSLIETAELMRYYREGTWRPYEEDELVELVAQAIERTPAYCRLTRVIRDISAGDIVVGNKTANLRQVAERRLAERGVRPAEIRSREIRDREFDPAELHIDEIQYQTTVGWEHFLQVIDEQERLFGFLRLSLPERACFPHEIAHSAMIREVHVYGAMSRLGEREGGHAQHLGLGRRLIERAVQIASESGYADLAVISALGTRTYYDALGFERGELYQHRALEAQS